MTAGEAATTNETSVRWLAGYAESMSTLTENPPGAW